MVVQVAARSREMLLWLSLFAFAAAADASVIASVDRDNVELNESFTLKVTVDTAIDTIPDASALETDFHIGATSQLSNTTIINGQISRSRTWTYVLMAKRAGDLLIPPIRVASEESNPLYITVAPQSEALPGEADIYVTSEVDFAESYVQAQVLYTVKVYRAVATRQPRLSEPSVSGVEVITEIAGEERSYESILNGKSYNVVERVYALFPQQSGELDIAPARFEARVLRDGRITGRKIFESDAINVVVNPIPPPPVDFPNAAWLPAKSIELGENWSRDPSRLPAGEPITRHITVTALGQLSTQIPVLEPDVPDQVKVYPDKPELRVTAQADGILAFRKDQYAIIGISPGDVTLPALSLPWWSLGDGEWKIARLPETTISVLPGANAMPTLPPREETVASMPATTTIVQSVFWRRVSEALAVVWALTVFTWWWTRRPRSRTRQVAEPPLHKQQARCLKNARRAAREHDAAGVKAALFEWARLQWPDCPPRSIGALANRVSDPLAGALRDFCNARYGPQGMDWDGDALARSMRVFTILESDVEQRAHDVLPPLMPESTSI